MASLGRQFESWRCAGVVMCAVGGSVTGCGPAQTTTPATATATTVVTAADAPRTSAPSLCAPLRQVVADGAAQFAGVIADGVRPDDVVADVPGRPARVSLPGGQDCRVLRLSAFPKRVIYACDYGRATAEVPIRRRYDQLVADTRLCLGEAFDQQAFRDAHRTVMLFRQRGSAATVVKVQLTHAPSLGAPGDYHLVVHVLAPSSS